MSPAIGCCRRGVIKSTSTIQLTAVLQTALTLDEGLMTEALLLKTVQRIHSVPDSLVSSVMGYMSVLRFKLLCKVACRAETHWTSWPVQQMFLLTHSQAKLRFLPVSYSQGYLHQWGTWSTSGYHCPEQKNAAEKISTNIMCWLNNRKGRHWI